MRKILNAVSIRWVNLNPLIKTKSKNKEPVMDQDRYFPSMIISFNGFLPVGDSPSLIGGGDFPLVPSFK